MKGPINHNQQNKRAVSVWQKRYQSFGSRDTWDWTVSPLALALALASDWSGKAWEAPPNYTQTDPAKQKTRRQEKRHGCIWVLQVRSWNRLTQLLIWSGRCSVWWCCSATWFVWQVVMFQCRRHCSHLFNVDLEARLFGGVAVSAWRSDRCCFIGVGWGILRLDLAASQKKNLLPCSTSGKFWRFNVQHKDLKPTVKCKQQQQQHQNKPSKHLVYWVVATHFFLNFFLQKLGKWCCQLDQPPTSSFLWAKYAKSCHRTSAQFTATNLVFFFFLWFRWCWWATNLGQQKST